LPVGTRSQTRGAQWQYHFAWSWPPYSRGAQPGRGRIWHYLRRSLARQLGGFSAGRHHGACEMAWEPVCQHPRPGRRSLCAVAWASASSRSVVPVSDSWSFDRKTLSSGKLFPTLVHQRRSLILIPARAQIAAGVGSQCFLSSLVSSPPVTAYVSFPRALDAATSRVPGMAPPTWFGRTPLHAAAISCCVVPLPRQGLIAELASCACATTAFAVVGRVRPPAIGTGATAFVGGDGSWLGRLF